MSSPYPSRSELRAQQHADKQASPTETSSVEPSSNETGPVSESALSSGPAAEPTPTSATPAAAAPHSSEQPSEGAPPTRMSFREFQEKTGPALSVPVATAAVEPGSARGGTRKSRGAGRMALQVIGELLMTAGVFLLLFVVWQLFWTTFKAEGEMREATTTFQTEHPAAVDKYTEIQLTDDPPVLGTFPEGQVFGVLHVPKWNFKQVPIVQGTTTEILAAGSAGHYVETQMPGEIGNFAVAAHRTTYGEAFRHIHYLTEGDALVVETDQAWLVYKVTSHEIVQPTAVEVLAPVPGQPGVEPTGRFMTLTTCHPEFGNWERYIVFSEFAYWVPKSEGIPTVLQAGQPSTDSGTTPEQPATDDAE